MKRLDSGGRDIDRTKAISFRFNGRVFAGFAGDTVASALLANGMRVVGRSFKYHRPRGVVGAGIEETNALLQILGDRDEPNVRATVLPITDSLNVESVNCWPGPRFDVGAAAGLLAPLIPAGFYYKTFLWKPWDFYGRFIRRMAGLGRAPAHVDVGHYERVHHHTDVLIVGAGPAGLAAARNAALSGARVFLLDDRAAPGGQLQWEETLLDHRPSHEWIAEMAASLDALPNVTRMTQTVASGYYDHNLVIAVEQSPPQSWIRERLWHIRATHVILATGAVERPLVFSNNDRPGVMLSSAASSYVTRFAVAPGHRAVYFTNNSSAYASAATLHDAGVEVAAIVDSRREPGVDEMRIALERGIRVHAAHCLIDVRGTMQIRGAVAAPLAGGREFNIPCDLVCVSGGWNPIVHLHSHAGSKPVYDDETACFVPGAPAQSAHPTGSARGLFETSAVITDGFRAGLEAARRFGYTGPDTSVTVDTNDLGYRVEPLWHVEKRRGKAFVDFQNDVTLADIELAHRENFRSIEHVKRYTTAGMATDQGKVSNVNIIGVLSGLTGSTPGETGTTTFRPPYQPVSFGVIGGMERGQLIIPARTTPITAWNREQGAAMNEAGGNFRRPFYYPRSGESMLEAVRREALAVRNGVGIYDGTPLGTFELHGPDVPVLLNRIYTNNWEDLPIGQGRFGLMLREDGRLMDDGVTFRIGEHEYLMSCGTGAASMVLTHIERLLQCEWNDLKVYLVNVSAHWATLCVCGPLSREVLTAAGVDVDLSNDFKFLQIRTGHVSGFEARISRVSYTGELSYEINVRRRHARAVWESLMEAGKPFDITPVGSETSSVLRIEKGFIAPGIEGDNITNPHDAGMSWIVDMNKGDFVGRRSLVRDQRLGGIRQHVVGLLPTDSAFVVAEGSALLPLGFDRDKPEFQGHVTASCFSPTLDRAIALGLLKNGHHRHGESIVISGLARSVEATVVPPVFYDPKVQRMRG